MKSKMIPVFIFEMKQNVRETESNWCFRKKCKNVSLKQESVSDAAFKIWPFSSNFNFAYKMVESPQQHASTTVHWL